MSTLGIRTPQLRGHRYGRHYSGLKHHVGERPDVDVYVARIARQAWREYLEIRAPRLSLGRLNRLLSRYVELATTEVTVHQLIHRFLDLDFPSFRGLREERLEKLVRHTCYLMLKHGHGYVNHALEDAPFSIPVLGFET